ncbi:MAG TPA: helix-turn-helix domain-containing protein [Spirillospora sp.]|nr:helix-turn-helix domain-containing protein [Spirillospora sp.]
MHKADLILHPVRLRILITLAGREMTPRELAAALPDVAQATLYRQINTLADAQLLMVVAENPVRGTVEKVYALAEDGAHLTPADMAAMSKDDHIRLFTTFITKLLRDFTAYVNAHEQIDLAADGVSYRQAPVYLSDAELEILLQEAQSLLLPYLRNEPTAERRRRLLTTIVMPDETTPGE